MLHYWRLIFVCLNSSPLFRYGKPGVQFSGQHVGDLSVTKICFLPEEVTNNMILVEAVLVYICWFHKSVQGSRLLSNLMLVLFALRYTC